MARIPRHLLIAAGPFGPRLHAATVVAAIARGIADAGRPAPDDCPLELAEETPEDVRALLDALGFEARMRAARAVVIAWQRLSERTLAGSAAFEIATRARQAGVPAYAITAHDELDAFDARMLDLQLVLRARGAKGLTEAGKTLAELA